MNPAPTPAPRRAGFTIIELTIALLILVVGVLGLVGTSTQITRMITIATLDTDRSKAFQSVIETIQALPFDSIAAGSDSVGGFFVQWTPQATVGRSVLIDVVTTGRGLTAAEGGGTTIGLSVSDTFTIRRVR